MNSEVKRGGLVVPMRPQISVELNQYDEVVISTASVGDDFDSVEIKDIVIPLESIKEVANAMLKLLDENG